MKKTLLLAISLITLSLVACGNNETNSSSTITTDSNLKMGEPRQLNSTLTGNVTWTSSQPEVIAVSSTGLVSGLRLNVTPVTITASNGSKTQTVQLNTYGLELTMCTDKYSLDPLKPNLCALTKFRTKSGAIAGDPAVETDAKKINIYSPSGEFKDKLRNSVIPSASGKSATINYYTDYVPEDGIYTASVEVGGETYKASAVMDSKSTAEGILDADIIMTDKTYEIKGKFGVNTGAVRLSCMDGDGSLDYLKEIHTSLPAKGTHSLNKPIRCDLYSYTVNPFDFTTVTPKQVNIATQLYVKFFQYIRQDK